MPTSRVGFDVREMVYMRSGSPVERMMMRQRRASFVGIVVALHPCVIIEVPIDRPRQGSHFGALADSAFSDIAATTMNLLGVTPDNPGTQFVRDKPGPVT